MLTSQLFVLIILCLVGIVNTIYLSIHGLKGTDVKCIFFPPQWCRKVQFSKFSKTLGVPNSFAGLGMYTAILFFIIIYLLNIFPLWPVAGLVAFGFVFSLYFTFIQAFVIKAFCTWCVLSGLDFFLMFYVVFSLIYKFF